MTGEDKQHIQVGSPQSDHLVVACLGAKMTLRLVGEIVLGKYVRGDGKVGITHLCSPIFGPDKKNLYGLLQHGDMRNNLCDVRKFDGQTISVAHTIVDRGYPDGVNVSEELKLADGACMISIAHHNTGVVAVAVNAGIHCYFDAPQGYRGVCVNDVDITSYLENHVNGYLLELPAQTKIVIPGKRGMIMESDGFEHLMVWVGRNPQTGEMDRDYVCLEPVQMHPDEFGLAKSHISPNAMRHSSLKISFA